MAERAILFGINKYDSISNLNGCENDVANIHRLLTSAFGFEDKYIHEFVNEDVTRERIEDEFAWLVDGAKPGDRLVFHFSGHGSYLPSDDGDEDVDELLCLVNMDWDDADSYLLDDDLGDLTRTAPEGAHLTIILDCCHSGSGTRALTRTMRSSRSLTPKTRLLISSDTARQIDAGRSVEMARELEAGDATALQAVRDADTEPVFARFVHPPHNLQVRGARSVHRLGTLARTTMNHQLLAGAADIQTAADAYIENAYHGAFSFYLCDTARALGSGASVRQIMERTTNTIKSKGYGQTPQSEGPFAASPLFGGDAVEAPPEAGSGDVDTDTELPAISPPSLKAEASLADARPLELLGDLLRVSEKLIDLASAERAITGVDASGLERAVGDECVVYVHGISEHRPGYSIPWFSAMRRHLARTIERQEVVWSDHVNAREVERSAQRAARQVLSAEIQAELERRASRIEEQMAASGQSARMVRERAFSVDDFTRYMFSETTRNLILAEFDTIVRPLLRSGKTLHIIGHSWGTVVSYEGLRRMDNESFSGRVANLFTVGAALSIGAVQSNLRGRLGHGRRPAHVRRIINLDAGGDIVGGPIGDEYPVQREFIGLPPVGCSTIPFTNIAFNPSCAHSSYFRQANTEVNDRIFARFIN